MPGIITSSGGAGSVKTYRAIFTSTSTSVAINFVNGTTSTSGPFTNADKGIFVIFQNQSTALSITIGGPDVTATQGIILGPLTTSASVNQANNYTVFTAGSFSGIQMGDFYVTATASGAIAVAQLIKGV